MGLRGKHTNVYIDSSVGAATDVTAQCTEITGLPSKYDEIEDSKYGQDHSTMKGQGDSTVQITLDFNDTVHALITHETTGALKSDTARTILCEYGENAAPTTGDLTVTGEYVLVSAQIQTAKDGKRQVVTSWRLSGGTMPSFSTKGA